MTVAAVPAPHVTAAHPSPPAPVWKRLATMLAAPGRNRMRLWNSDTGKFSVTTKLTERLPARPAAVYLYNHRRTHLIWLDFDAKRYGPDAVKADLAAASSWITSCGGVLITDRSTSGGAHLICPLAIGTSASRDEMTDLVRLLAARLPTLDITPNTNAETGCMTPPGSPCREGGYRQLDGTLDQAIDTLTTRSASDLLPRLYMLLGALKTPARPDRSMTTTRLRVQDCTDGHGDELRLSATHIRTDPLPPEVIDFAIHGTIAANRPTWQSRHEARMSVVTQALARGHSLATLRTLIAPGGPWHAGLGTAYQRYHHRADQALQRDVTKSLDWLTSNVINSSHPRHKTKYSPGGQQGTRGPENLRRWLANALAWADQEFVGKRYRWTVHAVLQAMAFYALVAGEQRSGAWLVGVGGRTLSIGAGMLSEDTIWRVLADLRERPGAPLVLARHHVGTEPDVYALTLQNEVSTDPARVSRVRIEPVHEAWIVLGHHLRRVYELVAHHGLTVKADIYAAAGVPRATGDAMIADLYIAGLLAITGRGRVGIGSQTPHAVADRHHLEDARQQRLERHRAERAEWRAWLAAREELRAASVPPPPSTAALLIGGVPAPDGPAESEHAAWLESVMATGPPGGDQGAELHAIELIADILGARIVSA